MSIGTKTLSIFLVLVLGLTGLAVYSIDKGRDNIVEATGLESTHYAGLVASVIDRAVYLKYHELFQAGGDELVQSYLTQSNLELDAVADPEEYLAEIDAEWVSTPLDESTPLMDEILANDVSERFEDQLVEHYIEEHAVMIYSSVSVVNKYGAVVGMSVRTAEYWYGDSSLWPELMEEGHYFGDIEHDPITNTHGMCVFVRLDDTEGNAFGAMMAFLNIVGVVDESVYLGKAYASTQLRVISLDGRMIYSEGVFHVFENVSNEEYFSAITGLEGYFLASENDRDRLFAYAVSSGYLRYGGGDWIVVIDHDASEVLQPVEELKTSIIASSALVIVASLVLYGLFAHSISSRVRTLASTTDRYSEGDLGARVDMRSADEIGQLGKAFNNMAGELETLYQDLENRVQVRTKELEQAMKKLQLLGSITRHDAINQVTVIMGWVSLIEEAVDDEDVLQRLNKIKEASMNLQRYLEFTGVYERVGAKRPEWIELGNAVTQSLFGLGPREFELRNELSGVHVYGDLMLPKVFRNLVDNSIAHGGEITSLSFTWREVPDGLQIVYEDDGVGIPEDMKERIFGGIPQSGRKSLGLYLSKEILSITGISIAETGEHGKGVRFEIHVPEDHYRIGESVPPGKEGNETV